MLFPVQFIIKDGVPFVAEVVGSIVELRNRNYFTRFGSASLHTTKNRHYLNGEFRKVYMTISPTKVILSNTTLI